ncbi:unnamed protein product [Polarella glacialis]|uniref:Uncharacterized protein n=1 Tax=Polarella glacialis TaxID=89957 RepID=A0A813DTE3_POLGL|nr:unnamed protein product [Polarella glacialis]
MQGLTGYNWYDTWCAARSRAGLDELQSGYLGMGESAVVAQPLLPVPLGDGTWSARPATSSEAAVWLRELLIARGFSAAEVANLGTHSCKATVLSWAAKRGLSLETRRALGYHVGEKDVSVLTYSRDAMGGPIRELEVLLSEIRSGTFVPDAGRSGRLPVAAPHAAVDASGEFCHRVVPSFTGRTESGNSDDLYADDAGHSLLATEEEDVCNFLLWMELPSTLANRVCLAEPEPTSLEGDATATAMSVDDTDGSLGSTSGEESLGAEDADEGVSATEFLAARSEGHRRAPTSSEIAYQHGFSGKYRWGRVGDDQTTACGKKVSDNFVRLKMMPSFAVPKCATCFGQ